MALRQLKAENMLARAKPLGPADIWPKLRDGRPRPFYPTCSSSAPRSSVASTADHAKQRAEQHFAALRRS